MAGLTKMWRIMEAPEYEIELTPGAWVVWKPCCQDENCSNCGGTNTQIADICGFAEGEGTKPSNPDMVTQVTGLKTWHPVRIQ